MFATVVYQEITIMAHGIFSKTQQIKQRTKQTDEAKPDESHLVTTMLKI
jgi:hypothetical protein